MVIEHIIRFFQDRPFPPFTIFTADSRQLEVRHPEQAWFSRRAESIYYFHPDHRVEVIDARLVVSLRTAGPADAAFFAE